MMEDLPGTARFVRRQDRPVTRLDDDLVFLDAEEGEYQVLRGTARTVWELLEDPKTLAELCSLLGAEYDVPGDPWREELVPFLDELMRLGLMERVSG